MAREVIDIIIQERGGRRVAQQVRDIGGAATGSAGAVQLLRGALRGLGVGVAVREVLRAIDSYQRMQNQLRVVGYEQNQLNQAMNDLFDIAQRTRTPLEATVSLYGKLAQSAGELGRSQAQMLEFTELVGQSLAIQGTSTAGSRAALLQLSQAMGEGIVRAQEYNSLIENARPLLVAAAAGMDEAGGSVARLRSLVIEGEVSSQEFFDAVIAGGEILREQFGATVPTIGQALTKLNNAWTKFIGESALGQTILSVVSGTLIFLADNFEEVATVVVTLTVAIGAYVGGGVLGALISRSVTAAGAQLALAGGFTAVNVASLLASGGIKLVVGGVRALTLAIAANPLGALLVAITLTLGYLYNMRNALVTVGDQTATVGSVIAEVWDRSVDAVKGFVDSALNLFSGWATNVSQWFADIGVNGRDMGNFLIAVVKSLVDAWVGQFRLLYQVAVSVFQGIASVGRNVFDGLGAAITGDFTAAGEAFGKAFSMDNFNVDNIVAEAGAIGAQIGDNFGRDFLGEAGAVIQNGQDFLTSQFEGVVAAAAERDALNNTPVQEFEFITPSGAVPDGGSGSGKAKKEQLTKLQEAYKGIVEETTGALKDLVAQQQALDLALQNGIINQDEYVVRAQDIRVGLAEWATEGQNVAAAMREANEAILQLKIDSGEGSFGDGFLLGLSRMTEGAANFTANAGSLFSDFFSDFTDGFANSIGRAIVYSEDLGEALQNVANEALASLISGLVKMGIQWLLNAAIGQSVGAAATAATVAQAGAAAASWAPAAALASLATVGANAAPAAAALATTTALSAALAQTGAAFADGGRVSGPGGPRDDKIIAALSNGEFVVNAKDAANNMGVLEAINSGLNLKKALPAFANGGMAVVGMNSSAPKAAQNAASDGAALDRAGSNRSKEAGPTVVEVPVKVVNISDPDAALTALQSDKGERTIMNILERNPELIKAILR